MSDYEVIGGQTAHERAISRLVAAKDAEIAALRKALSPFVEHGSACGAFGEHTGPCSIYTESGYRVVPNGDFRRARAALEMSGGVK